MKDSRPPEILRGTFYTSGAARVAKRLRGVFQAAASAAGYVLATAWKYPAKTTGLLGQIGSLSVLARGVTETIEKGPDLSNVMMTATGLLMAGLGLVLMKYGDQLKKAGEADPQDTPFSPRDVFNFKSYPHETVAFWGVLSGLATLGLSGAAGLLENPDSEQVGKILMTAIDLGALYIATFIRQKPPEEAQSFLEEHTTKAVASIYQLGVTAYMTAYLYGTGGLANADPEALMIGAGFTAANFFYFHANKRRGEISSGPTPAADPSP